VYLDERLKSEGVDTIVLVGMWTDMCIIATAGIARGYDVVFVKDAVTSGTGLKRYSI
jgi:nicotinamidase-related amidase